MGEWVTDPQTGFQYYVADAGNVITPTSNEPPAPVAGSPEQNIQLTTSTQPSSPSSSASPPLVSSQSGQPVTTGYTYDEWGNPIPITYTPPEVAATQPSNTEVYTQELGQGATVPISQYNPATSPTYKPTLDYFNQQTNQFTQDKQSFDSKWSPLITTNGSGQKVFTGNESQFTQYQQEYSQIKQRFDDISSLQDKVMKDYISIGNSQYMLVSDWDNLSSEDQQLIQSQGYDAYLNSKQQELANYQVQLIKSKQQEDALNKIKSTSGAYSEIAYPQDMMLNLEAGKQPQYNLVNYLRANPGDIDTIIKADFKGMTPDSIATLDKAVQDSQGYWTSDGKLQAFDALVAGKLTQEEIKTLTGSEIDTSVPIPLNAFGDSFIKSHPIISPITGKAIDAGPNLEGIGVLNYPQFYADLRKRYNDIYGTNSATAATARGMSGELLASFIGPMPIKLLEPSLGPSTVNANDWVQLTIGIATLAMPLWLPKAFAILPKLNPVGEVGLELADGSTARLWKGIRLVDNPIIGKNADGKLVIGTKDITFPESLKLKLPTSETPGNFTVEPRTGLDTKVLSNAKTLKSLGVSDAGINQIQETLPRVQSFYGRESPINNPSALATDIKTLSQNGVKTVFQQAIKDADIVDVVKHYGSTSMLPQIPPEDISGWIQARGGLPGDIDIQLGNVSQDAANGFAQRLLKSLQDVGENVYISPDKPTLIQTRSGAHAVDIHTAGEVGLTETSGGYATQVYGLNKSGITPVAEVDMPGVGKVKLAGLSETGIGKAEQVLSWRYNPATGEIDIGPASFRVKDYVDLYEVIKTFGGEENANSWAKSLGLDIDELAKAASESPLDWEFKPSSTSTGISSTNTGVTSIPSIITLSPQMMSVASSIPIGTDSTGQLITISPYSPSEIASPKAISIPSSIESSAPFTSSSISPVESSASVPSEASKVSISSNISPSESSTVVSEGSSSISSSEITSPDSLSSTNTKSESPSIGNTVIKSPSITSPKNESTSVSNVESPSSSSISPKFSSAKSPSPVSIKPPSVKPPSSSTITIPNIYSPTSEKPLKSPIVSIESNINNQKIQEEHPPITWKQGFVFRSILWNQDTGRYDIVKVSKYPLPGATIVEGIGSAYKSIQALGGNADVLLTMDMGIVDVVIDKPSRIAGKSGAIRFKRDRYQMTDGDLTAKGVRLS